MAGISSPGIGSGLDVNSLVTQLVAAEGQATSTRLDRQEVQLQAKLSAYGTFKGALSDFQSALSGLKSLSSFQVRTATSSNTTVFTATASSGAAAGTHSITVSKLAESQKLASSAFSDTTTTVGTGTLTFQFGTFSGGTFTPNAAKSTQSVIIDAAHDSLQGIRDAVNSANIGVTASIVNDGTGNRLAFSANDTGAANGIKLMVSDADGVHTDTSGLSRLAYDPAAAAGAGKNLSETITAVDAELTVDGIQIKSASNTLTTAIEGVTLNLLSAPATGNSGTLTVALDKSSVSSAVNGFVSKYNALIDQIGKLSSYDAATKKGGVLLGDATLRGITGQLRRVLSEAVQGVSGAYASLADIGITTDINGKLKLDSTKLQKALDTDFDAVGRVFTAGGAATDPLIKYVSSTADTQPDGHAVDITRLATQGRYEGAAIADFPLTVDGNNDTLTVKVNGVPSGTVSLTQKAYASGTELAMELQSRINGDSALKAASATVTVTYSGGKIAIVSDHYGSASTVEVTSVDTSASLGLSVAAGTSGEDVAGTIGGSTATGSGRTLTGSGDAQGLAIEVQGGGLGARGSVQFSRGVADRLGSLLSDLLDADGSIESATKGLSDRVKDIGKQREALSARLERVEARYRAQFTALDTLLGRMRTTSDYLTRQLAALPSANQQES